MTRRRWIADEISGDRAALTGKQAAHLTRVLRVRAGQEFEIAAQSRVRLGRVSAIFPERVEFELGEDIQSTLLPSAHLLLAIFKFDRMEWAIEKVTELGVSAITPVLAQRSERNLCGSAVKRVERWRRIAREAAQQSRRSVPPEILAPSKLNDAVKNPATTRIVLAEAGAETSLKAVLQGSSPPIGLAVGPEGGWTDTEIAIFRNAGWILASLGSTILRAETAAIVAVAMAVQMLQA